MPSTSTDTRSSWRTHRIAAPTSSLLTPIAYFEDPTNLEICEADRYCVARRYNARVATAYPARYLSARCCDPELAGEASCADYLETSYGDVLTVDELAEAVVLFEGLCE